MNGCGPGTGNGSFNSTCNVVGTDDGTCTPLLLADGGTLGVCAQGGTATSTCNSDANRLDLIQVCGPGQTCVGGAIGLGGICGDVCDPQLGATGGGRCTGGELCAIEVDDPLTGACYTP